MDSAEALWTAKPGCIVDTDTNFCICDRENGWNIGTGGACVSDCVTAGEGTNTGGTDACWPTSTVADLTAL